MFTGCAFFFAGALALLASWSNKSDRPQYEVGERTFQLFLHLRQDIKLIAYLLFGVIVMLGVVADAIVMHGR